MYQESSGFASGHAVFSGPVGAGAQISGLSIQSTSSLILLLRTSTMILASSKLSEYQGCSKRGLLIKNARSHRELEESQKRKVREESRFRGAGSSQVPGT